MCKTRRGRALLSWILMLSLTAGLSIHGHDTLGAGDCICVKGHEHSGHLDSADEPARLSAAAPLHEHHCLGCHFQGKRNLPKPSQSGGHTLDLSIDDLSSHELLPLVRIMPSGVSLRGPPAS